MIQDLITYSLIAAAAGYVLFNMYSLAFPSKRKPAQSHCGGCAGCQLKTVQARYSCGHQ